MNTDIGLSYISFFKTLKIKSPTIIGEAIDYSPLYNLLSLNIFEFLVDDQKITTSDMIRFLQYNHETYVTIMIRCVINYNNQTYYSQITQNPITLNGISDKQSFIFNVMLELIHQIKNEIYKNHPLQLKSNKLKDDLYSMYQNLYHYSEINVPHIELLHKMINDINSKLDKEFDETIFGKDSSNIQLIPPPIINENDIVLNEDQEFEKVEQELIDGSKSLKLDLRAIRVLHKEKSDKFVLPLKGYDWDDLAKWDELTKKPFKFLSYNDAMFSINLDFHWSNKRNISHLTDKVKVEWYNLWATQYKHYTYATDKINGKKQSIISRRKKLKKVKEKLNTQVNELKTQFIERSKKYKNPKLLNFMAERTATNIKTIRSAEILADDKIRALEQKKLVKTPGQFFKRAVKLYLGRTGDDIIKDMTKLGLNSLKDYRTAIEYLYFLMNLIETNEDKYFSPILPIFSIDEFDSGFVNLKLLKVIAGHMFIHTITLSKNIPPPKPKEPEPRIVME